MNSDRQKLPQEIRILLVEDHADTLITFSKFLRSKGYIVHTADGYQAAMDLVTTERFDLAICDISLWDGDGCQLLEDLRKLQDLKAIAVTAFTLADEVETYREAGFAAVFQKPFEPSQITAVINQLTQAMS